jgi:glycosyltransferase involved in cell wall biosynthesis
MFIMSDRFVSSKNGIGRDHRAFLQTIEDSGHKINMLQYKHVFDSILIRPRRTFLKFSASIVISPQVGVLVPIFFKPRIWAVRIHDLFPLTNPKDFKLKARILFYLGVRFAVFRKALFLANSNYTAKELVRIFPRVSNLEVIECNTSYDLQDDLCFRCDGCLFLKGHDSSYIKLRYLLLVGTIEPRKGYFEFLSALNQLKNLEPIAFHVVIVGAPGWKCEKEIRLLQSFPGLSWLKNSCDGSLKQLYQGAECLISNSSDEGFGLPLYEARKLGCPVIARKIEIYQQLHGENITYFSASELFNTLSFLNLQAPRDTRKNLAADVLDSNFELAFNRWLMRINND